MGKYFFFIPLLTAIGVIACRSDLNLQPLINHSQVDSGAKHACAVCLVSFPTDIALHQHAKETEHQAYECKCGTGFNKHSTLRRHIDTKNAPKTFSCVLCYQKFDRNDKVKDHCRHYHKVTDEGLRKLFDTQRSRPRGVAASRCHQTLAAASSAPAPAAVPAPPALAPASAGPSFWSPSASAGQQYAEFSAGLFVPTGPFVTNGSFISPGAYVPAADSFAATPALDEGISGAFDDIFGDETWAAEFDGFNS